MRKSLMPLAATVLLGACGYVSEYEKTVFDYQPVYCYQTIGEVQCFETPNHRDSRRMVNYYGPAPAEAAPAPAAAPAPGEDAGSGFSIEAIRKSLEEDPAPAPQAVPVVPVGTQIVPPPPGGRVGTI